MKLRLRTLFAPKEGNSDADYEDAFADGGDAKTGRIAVADGASAAVFARPWARILAEDFARKPFAEAEIPDRLATLGRVWREKVTSDGLPWYAQEKITAGSYATLLIVEWDLPGKRWTARAVGDACVFVVRDDRLAASFPVVRSTDFDTRPDLLSTEPNAPIPTFQSQTGDFAPGDRFFLMTDALAAYFLDAAESGRAPWDALPKTQPDLDAWLAERRADNSLKNDDVTLVTVAVSE